MQNLQRHAYHVVEVEQVTIETLEQLAKRQETNFALLSHTLSQQYSSRANEYLSFQCQMMRSLRWRAEATQRRLETEITLVTRPPLLYGSPMLPKAGS